MYKLVDFSGLEAFHAEKEYSSIPSCSNDTLKALKISNISIDAARQMILKSKSLKDARTRLSTILSEHFPRVDMCFAFYENSDGSFNIMCRKSIKNVVSVGDIVVRCTKGFFSDGITLAHIVAVEWAGWDWDHPEDRFVLIAKPLFLCRDASRELFISPGPTQMHPNTQCIPLSIFVGSHALGWPDILYWKIRDTNTLACRPIPVTFTGRWLGQTFRGVEGRTYFLTEWAFSAADLAAREMTRADISTTSHILTFPANHLDPGKYRAHGFIAAIEQSGPLYNIYIMLSEPMLSENKRTWTRYGQICELKAKPKMEIFPTSQSQRAIAWQHAVKLATPCSVSDILGRYSLFPYYTYKDY